MFIDLYVLGGIILDNLGKIVKRLPSIIITILINLSTVDLVFDKIVPLIAATLLKPLRIIINCGRQDNILFPYTDHLQSV